MGMWERYALEIFGAIPRGRVFGCQVWEDPTMPVDRVRFVDPITGCCNDMPLPTPEARGEGDG